MTCKTYPVLPSMDSIFSRIVKQEQTYNGQHCMLIRKPRGGLATKHNTVMVAGVTKKPTTINRLLFNFFNPSEPLENRTLTRVCPTLGCVNPAHNQLLGGFHSHSV